MKQTCCLGALPLLLLIFSPFSAHAESTKKSGEIRQAALDGAENVPGVSCALAEDAIRVASRIRKLAIMKKVPCRVQNKTEVEHYLREAITRDVPKEKILLEGKVFTLLGLIPKSFDYYNGLVSLYTEQLAGYYEPDGHFYAMASWIPAQLQLSIATHELTHALQDQHFNLSNFTDESKLSNDELLARTAVVEGDAMGVMLDRERLKHHLPMLEQLDAVEPILASELVSAASISGSGAPQTLEHLMMFPYLSGLRFVHAMLKHGGHSAVDSAFLLPPESTEQILHPELFYHRRENPGYEKIVGVFGDLREFANLSSDFSDTMGEFTISVLLSQWVSPARASEAASGWGGDRLQYFQNAEKKTSLLLWQSRWDTEKDATEFFQALSEGYEKRFENKGPQVVSIQEPQRRELRGLEIGDVKIEISARDVNLWIYGQE